MRYIVWELISPFDGYGTTECATWEEAVACVTAVMTAPGCRRSQEARTQYKQWLAGKIPKIQTFSGRGRNMTVDIEMFITSTPLTEPLP